MGKYWTASTATFSASSFAKHLPGRYIMEKYNKLGIGVNRCQFHFFFIGFFCRIDCVPVEYHAII